MPEDRYVVVVWDDGKPEGVRLQPYAMLHDTRESAHARAAQMKWPGVMFAVARVAVIEDDAWDLPDEGEATDGD